MQEGSTTRWGLEVEALHRVKGYPLGTIIQIGNKEFLGVTQKEICRFELARIIDYYPYQMTSLVAIPDTCVVVGVTSVNSEFWAFTVDEMGSPYKTGVKTGDCGIFTMFYSPKSNSIITCGETIKCWKFNYTLPAKNMSFSEPKFEIYFQSDICKSSPSILNPPMFEYERERVIVDDGEGCLQSYSLRGTLMDTVIKFGCNKSSIGFYEPSRKFLSNNAEQGMVLWSEYGSVMKRFISLGLNSALAIRFITSEFVSLLDANRFLSILDVKTGKFFPGYQFEKAVNRLYAFSNPYPRIIACTGSNIVVLKASMVWKLWMSTVAQPVEIERCPKSYDSARIMVRCADSHIILASPATAKALTAITLQRPAHAVTAYYDRGVNDRHCSPRDQVIMPLDNGTIPVFGTQHNPCERLFTVDMRVMSMTLTKYHGELCFCFGTNTGHALFYSYSSFEPVGRAILIPYPIRKLFYHDQSGSLLAVFSDRVVQWNVHEEKIIEQMRIIPSDVTMALDNLFVFGYQNGKIGSFWVCNGIVKIHDTDSLKMHDDGITSFSRGSSFFCSTSIDQSLRVWRNDFTMIHQIHFPLPLYSCCVLNGKRDILIGLETDIMVMKGEVVFGTEVDDEDDRFDNFDKLQDLLEINARTIGGNTMSVTAPIDRALRRSGRRLSFAMAWRKHSEALASAVAQSLTIPSPEEVLEPTEETCTDKTSESDEDRKRIIEEMMALSGFKISKKPTPTVTMPITEPRQNTNSQANDDDEYEFEEVFEEVIEYETVTSPSMDDSCRLAASHSVQDPSDSDTYYEEDDTYSFLEEEQDNFEETLQEDQCSAEVFQEVDNNAILSAPDEKQDNYENASAKTTHNKQLSEGETCSASDENTYTIRETDNSTENSSSTEVSHEYASGDEKAISATENEYKQANETVTEDENEEQLSCQSETLSQEEEETEDVAAPQEHTEPHVIIHHDENEKNETSDHEEPEQRRHEQEEQENEGRAVDVHEEPQRKEQRRKEEQEDVHEELQRHGKENETNDHESIKCGRRHHRYHRSEDHITDTADNEDADFECECNDLLSVEEEEKTKINFSGPEDQTYDNKCLDTEQQTINEINTNILLSDEAPDKDLEEDNENMDLPLENALIAISHKLVGEHSVGCVCIETDDIQSDSQIITVSNWDENLGNAGDEGENSHNGKSEKSNISRHKMARDFVARGFIPTDQFTDVTEAYTQIINETTIQNSDSGEHTTAEGGDQEITAKVIPEDDKTENTCVDVLQKDSYSSEEGEPEIESVEVATSGTENDGKLATVPVELMTEIIDDACVVPTGNIVEIKTEEEQSEILREATDKSDTNDHQEPPSSVRSENEITEQIFTDDEHIIEEVVHGSIQNETNVSSRELIGKQRSGAQLCLLSIEEESDTTIQHIANLEQRNLTGEPRSVPRSDLIHEACDEMNSTEENNQQEPAEENSQQELSEEVNVVSGSSRNANLSDTDQCMKGSVSRYIIRDTDAAAEVQYEYFSINDCVTDNKIFNSSNDPATTTTKHTPRKTLGRLPENDDKLYSERVADISSSNLIKEAPVVRALRVSTPEKRTAFPKHDHITFKQRPRTPPIRRALIDNVPVNVVLDQDMVKKVMESTDPRYDHIKKQIEPIIRIINRPYFSISLTYHIDDSGLDFFTPNTPKPSTPIQEIIRGAKNPPATEKAVKQRQYVSCQEGPYILDRPRIPLTMMDDERITLPSDLVYSVAEPQMKASSPRRVAEPAQFSMKSTDEIIRTSLPMVSETVTTPRKRTQNLGLVRFARNRLSAPQILKPGNTKHSKTMSIRGKTIK